MLLLLRSSFCSKIGPNNLPYTAYTMPTQNSWTRDKTSQKVMDRGQDLLQVKTFLKPFSPQLIPHSEGTRGVFVRKWAPTFHHAPASQCCAMLYGLLSHESPRQSNELFIFLIIIFSYYCFKHLLSIYIFVLDLKKSIFTPSSMVFYYMMVSFLQFYFS